MSASESFVIVTTPKLTSGPLTSGTSACGRVPNCRYDTDRKKSSPATVTAERAVVDASGSQVAMIHPSSAETAAPMTSAMITMPHGGTPSGTNLIAKNARVDPDGDLGEVDDSGEGGHQDEADADHGVQPPCSQARGQSSDEVHGTPPVLIGGGWNVVPRLRGSRRTSPQPRDV